MREKRNDYRALGWTPERKRPIGRTMHRWKDNIKMDLKEAGWVSMNWNNLVQDRNKVTCCFQHSTEPSGSVQCR
jgi:hypothetical protein